MSLQVPSGGGGIQPHRLDSDEICIREAIRKYYVFIHKVDTLRDEIGQLGNIDEQTRLRVLDQLDDIESELQCEGGEERGGKGCFHIHCTYVCDLVTSYTEEVGVAYCVGPYTLTSR